MDKNIWKKIIYALTIEERKKAFAEKGFLISDDTILIDEVWLNKRTLCIGSNFDEMLKVKEISKDEFSFLMKNFDNLETEILYDFVKKQEWYTFYLKIREDFINSDHKINNLYLTEIFNLHIKNKITEIELKNILLSSEAQKDLIYNICLQINEITWKVIVTEIDKSEKNNYKDFFDFLEKNYETIDALEQLYFSYPVLLRLVIQKTLDITDNVCKMLYNLDNYFYEIEKILQIKSNVIRKIQIGLGDTHDKGKTVTKIIFENGQSYFYKPHNLFVEKAFYQLAQELNLKIDKDLFYINKVYYHKEFTIESTVENLECTESIEIKKYYYRTGAILALMTILQGTDFHSENIIANGSFPVIVDFETFFSHNRYQYYGQEWNNIDIIETLISTAMLPTQACNNNEEKKGIEIGGICGGQSVQLPTPRLIPKNIFTLDMEFEDKLLWKQEDKNIPILRGIKQLYNNYIEEIGTGFNDILLYILKNKEFITRCIIRLFNELKVREVLKPTVVYYDLLQYANHPSYLKNMVDLERLFSNSFSYPYSNKEVVKYEIESLLHLEIPLFYTYTSQKNIYYNEKKIVSNIFERTAMEDVLVNVSSLSRKKIAHTRAFLLAQLGKQYETGKAFSINESCKNFYSKEKIEKVLHQLIEELFDSALYTKNKEFVTWKTVGEDPQKVLYRNMDESLYSGRSGVLLILEEYLKYYHNERISNLRTILKESIIKNYYLEDTCLFSGSNGYFYSALRYNSEINSTVLNRVLWNILSSNLKKIDILSGSSSYVPVLDILVERYDDKNLIYQSQKKIGYFIKQNLMIEKENLKGLGHGYMGILYALCLLEKRFKGQYINDIKLLTDTLEQDFDKIGTLNNSWCNGVSGIGLAALKSSLYLDNEVLRVVADKCLNIIKNNKVVTDLSICHGIGSEIEFLIEYQKQCGVNIQNLIDNRIFSLLDIYEKNRRFQLYENQFCKNWGLFTGRCGVIYMLLRYLHPNIPSILTLEFKE